MIQDMLDIEKVWIPHYDGHRGGFIYIKPFLISQLRYVELRTSISRTEVYFIDIRQPRIRLMYVSFPCVYLPCLSTASSPYVYTVCSISLRFEKMSDGVDESAGRLGWSVRSGPKPRSNIPATRDRNLDIARDTTRGIGGLRHKKGLKNNSMISLSAKKCCVDYPNL